MPWLTIIMALLSYFASRASGASGTQALLTAGLAGAATYYTSHETDWGKANLGSLDGVVTSTTPATTPDGAPLAYPDGTPVTTSSQIADVLKSWGGTGTAAVLGTGALAVGATTGGLSLKNPWVVGGIVAGLFLLLK